MESKEVKDIKVSYFSYLLCHGVSIWSRSDCDFPMECHSCTCRRRDCSEWTLDRRCLGSLARIVCSSVLDNGKSRWSHFADGEEAGAGSGRDSSGHISRVWSGVEVSTCYKSSLFLKDVV